MNFIWQIIQKIIFRLIDISRTHTNRVISKIINFFYSSPPPAHLVEQRKKIKIYDAFIFFNELDLLEIRLNILNSAVDYFVIVEATRTFTGVSKPLYYEINKDRFVAFKEKIIHIIVDDTPDSLKELEDRYETANALDRQIINYCFKTRNIPKNQPQWLREFYQKEQIQKGFLKTLDNDICYISDVDEIWNPDILIDYSRNTIFKFEEIVYAYYLNNRSSEDWYGTFASKYKKIKNKSINHLDTPSITKYTYIKNGGWHFTNQGGADAIKTKLESYGHQEFNNEKIKSQINQQIEDNKDFVGRKFKFWVDDSELPEYIKNNKQKYQNFFK